jgi:DNA modification methylase
MPLTIKDVISELPKIKNNSIDLMIIDPPYKKDFPTYFYDFKSKLKLNGQILWFCQPIELYDLPEKPLQILIWKEPYSPKPIRKKYREFFDIIAWYAYGEYTFNKLLWNLMNSIFVDVVIGN